jgi:hypothetical protein
VGAIAEPLEHCIEIKCFGHPDTVDASTGIQEGLSPRSSRVTNPGDGSGNVIGPVFMSGRKAPASDGSTGPMSPEGPAGSPVPLAPANPGRV